MVISRGNKKRINSISTINDIRLNRVILYFLKERTKIAHLFFRIADDCRKVFATDSC